MFLITITTINIISRGEWFIFERKWLGFCFLFSHCFRLLAGLKLELVISVHDDVNVDGREVFSLLHSFIYFVSTYCIWLIRRKSEKQEIFFHLFWSTMVMMMMMMCMYAKKFNWSSNCHYHHCSWSLHYYAHFWDIFFLITIRINRAKGGF